MAELGIDWRESPLDVVRVAYIRRLREQAAGRAAVGNIDLATERALLAREQREKIAMQNAVTRGELAPVILIEQVLSNAASKVAGIFDAIPGMVRRRVPQLSADDVSMIAEEIAKARNVVAVMSLANLAEQEAAEAAEAAEAEPLAEPVIEP